MFDSGAGVEVSVVNEQLVLNVFLPIEFVVSTLSGCAILTCAVTVTCYSPCLSRYALYDSLYNGLNIHLHARTCVSARLLVIVHLA